MTIGAILAAITALGAIAGAVTYLVKTGIWALRKSPEQKAEDIKSDVKKNEDGFRKTGRPQE